MHKSSGKLFIVKIIKYESGESSSSLSEMHLESLIEPLKQDWHNALKEHMIDEDFIYLVRPFFNRGNAL